MMWIADYDTHGREFPTCVHVTKTTCGITSGATYVPIWDAKEARTENTKLRELVLDLYRCSDPCNDCPHYNGSNEGFYCNLGIGWKTRRMRELGIEVPE